MGRPRKDKVRSKITQERVELVYGYIENYIGANHIAPSLREIEVVLGFSTSNAARYLTMLVQDGRLGRTPIKHVARGIYLLPKQRKGKAR